MRTSSLFTPYISVAVEDGEVVEVKVDWSDSLRNTWTQVDGHDDTELWTDGYRGADAPPDADIACSYLDSKEVREAVLAALQPPPVVSLRELSDQEKDDNTLDVLEGSDAE